MGIEKNKKIMLRYFDEFLNNQDYSKADEILHEEYSGSAGGGLAGVEGLKQYVSYMHSIWPDGHWETLEMIAEGDKVSIFQEFTGTFKGEFQGIQGKGQQNTVPIAAFYEFKDGKVFRGLTRGLTDLLAIYQQMGVLPPNEEIVKAYNDSLK